MKSNKSYRIEYIDWLRGVAVITMFVVHSAVAWLNTSAKTELYFTYLMRAAGMVAPTFMFLAGLSVAIIVYRNKTSGKDERQTKTRIAKRGLQILILGYALHLIMYVMSGMKGDAMRVFKVDILHCIGLSMLASSYIAWSKKQFNVSALLIALFLPVLSTIIYRFPVSNWLPSYLASYITIKSKYALFPVIPFAAWFMFGLFVGPIYIKAIENKQNEKHFWIRIIMSGILMFIIGKGIKYLYYAYDLDVLGVDTPQPKGLLHDFFFKGAVVLFLFFVSRITTKIIEKIPYTFVSQFGRSSLFAYCAHLLLIYPVAGNFLHRQITATQHAVLSIVLILVMFALTVFWDRKKHLLTNLYSKKHLISKS